MCENVKLDFCSDVAEECSDGTEPISKANAIYIFAI